MPYNKQTKLIFFSLRVVDVPSISSLKTGWRDTREIWTLSAEWFCRPSTSSTSTSKPHSVCKLPGAGSPGRSFLQYEVLKLGEHCVRVKGCLELAKPLQSVHEHVDGIVFLVKLHGVP